MNIREFERFMAKVDTSGDCWIWTGALESNGYGSIRIKVDGRWVSAKAHRVMWEHFHGPSPLRDDGRRMVIDHMCNNRGCVRPSHLQRITNRDNILRGSWSGKTHCPQGHAYEPDNFYTDKRTGSAVCKTCAKCRSKANRQRRRSGEYTPSPRKVHTQ